MEHSVYDEDSEALIIETDHLSVYGVGYSEAGKKYEDTVGHWAKEAIDYVVSRGFMSGTTASRFSPDEPISRADLAYALGRLAGINPDKYQNISFSDVQKSRYYAPYVQWAYKTGIMDAADKEVKKFAPDAGVSREEFALIFSSFMKACTYSLPKARQEVKLVDEADIDAAYKEAVKLLQQLGIIIAGSDNKFNPKEKLTRGQAAMMLYRFMRLSLDEDASEGWAVNDAGERMYYKDNKAQTGWQTIKRKKYYFTREGVMISGSWYEIDEKWYYFYPDGSMAVSTRIDGYQLDENGVRQAKY